VITVWFPSKLVERLLCKCSATAHKALQRYAWICTSKMGAKTGGARYSFSLLTEHGALKRDLPTTEQP